MSFKNWYGTLLPFEAKALTREEIFQAGAASRDAEIQRLQMALADVEALELGTAEKCDKLRAELVKALAACKAKDEALESCGYADDSTDPEMCGPYYDAELVQQALAIQPDDSVLKAWLGEPVWASSEDLKLVEEYGYKMLMVDDKKRGMADTPLYSPKELK